MKEIISPVVMNGSARTFSFKDVRGYKKRVEFKHELDMSFTTVIYMREKLSYFFLLFNDKVVFHKCSVNGDDVTYEEFEKFCEINAV